VLFPSRRKVLPFPSHPACCQPGRFVLWLNPAVLLFFLSLRLVCSLRCSSRPLQFVPAPNRCRSIRSLLRNCRRDQREKRLPIHRHWSHTKRNCVKPPTNS